MTTPSVWRGVRMRACFGVLYAVRMRVLVCHLRLCHFLRSQLPLPLLCHPLAVQLRSQTAASSANGRVHGREQSFDTINTICVF